MVVKWWVIFSSFYFSEFVKCSSVKKTTHTLTLFKRRQLPNVCKMEHGSNMINPQALGCGEEKEALGARLPPRLPPFWLFRFLCSPSWPLTIFVPSLWYPPGLGPEAALYVLMGLRLTVSHMSLCPQGQKQCPVCDKSTMRVE